MTDPRVTLTLHELPAAQASDVLATLQGDTPAATAAPTPQKKAATKKKTTTKKEPEGPTIDDVKAAGKACMEKHGADAARGVIKSFKVEKISDLKPEQYADVIAAMGAYEPADPLE